MKKTIIKIVALVFVLSFLTTPVKAENINVAPGTTLTGDQFTSTGCASYSLYCYSGAGIRLSLYYYDGSTSKKIGSSHDVWSSNETYPGKSSSWTSGSYHYSSLGNANDGISSRVANGTTWKTNGTAWFASCSSCTKITTSSKYSVFNLSYTQYKSSGGFETTSGFADYTESNNSEFRTWIDNYLKSKMKEISNVNEYFRAEIDGGRIQRYYITIEPIFRIWVNTNGPSGDNKKSSGYIGTVYELSKIYHYSRYSKALRSTSGSSGSFVGDILNATPSTIPATLEEKGWSWRVLNKYAYGVGVYKLSNYTEAVCECSETDYKCAKTYCDANATEANRKTCVTNICSVKDPGFANCSDDSSTEGTTTSCAASTSSSKKTCTKANSNTYYKTTCTETSYAYYNDSLPTSLSPGMGFSYSLLLSGTKKCNTEFDVDKWNFDYAVADNNTREKVLEKELSDYKNLSKDDLEGFKYNSSDANVTIDIEENVEKKEKTTTTKKLSHFAKINESDITVSNSTSEFKTMTETSKSKNKTFTSSMSSIYSLQDVCVDGATGDIYEATYNSRDKKYECEATSNGPYTKFFTNLKASPTVNNTTVKITKSSSSMDGLTNKCYYQVEDKPLSCVIEKNDNMYSLKIYSEHNIDYTKLRYVLSTDPNDENWSKIAVSSNTLANFEAADINSDGTLDETDATLLQQHLAKLPGGQGDVNGDGRVDITDVTAIQRYVSSSYEIELDGSSLLSNLTIYGKIKYEDKEDSTTICSINQIKKTTGEQCTVKYKPTQYDEIAKYCKSNWYTDKDNYMSEKACYNACTGIKSCKVQYSCYETIAKEEFCKKQYNPVTEANSYRACINDCTCSEGQAVYRPISLSNPFPNRKAGTNWRGYEDNIKAESTTKKAEYVIELSAKDIEEINSQTQDYNTSKKNAYIDYVWDSKSDTNGKYISKFIHDDNKDLFCIIDGNGECK